MLWINLKSKQGLPLAIALSLACLCLYVYVLRIMPSLFANGLVQAYRLNFSGYGQLFSAYYFTYAPLQLLAGLLADRYQMTPWIAVASMLCAMGCYLFANAHSLLFAELGQLAMGSGAGFIFIGILRSIVNLLGLTRFAFYSGLLISFGMLGAVLGNFFLIWLLGAWGWRLTCYLIATLGLLLAAFSCLLLLHHGGVSQSKALSEPSARWVLLSRDMQIFARILKNRRIWLQSLIGALFYVPIIGFAESWGGRYFNEAMQLTQERAMIMLGTLFAGFFLGAPLCGYLFDRMGQPQYILTVGAVAATILLSIILYVPELSLLNLGIFLLLLGFFSSAMVIIFSLNLQTVGSEYAGKVLGVSNFIVMLAGSVAWLIGGLLQFITRREFVMLALGPANHYQAALVVLPLSTLLAVCLTFYIKSKVDM